LGVNLFFIVLIIFPAMSQSLFWNLFAKKLTGEASPDELLELENLIRQNPGIVYHAEHVQHIWQDVPSHDAYESELAFEMHLNKLKENGIAFPELETALCSDTNQSALSLKPKNNWRLPVAMFTVILIAAFIWNRFAEKTKQPVEKNYGEVSTKPGSKTKLVLPDSTVVWLNAGSKLTYSDNFGVTNRNTTLTGEAFFDVKKGTIPFVIHANSVHIKVMGTAFNVKAYPNEKTTETSLLRGRVEITFDKRPGEKWILKPNEKLILNNDPEKLEKTSIDKKSEPVYVMGNITRTLDSTILETSWVENKLIFQDESFADIAKKMERWYGVNIVFKDQTVADYHLYGSFTTETINEALDALKTTGSKFTYKIEGQNVTIAK